jgi:hypothetical protein
MKYQIFLFSWLMPLKISFYTFNFQGKNNSISIFYCKNIFEHNFTNQFQKYFWITFSTITNFISCIQHITNSIFNTSTVWQWLKQFWFYFLTFMCKNTSTTSQATFCVYLIMFSPTYKFGMCIKISFIFIYQIGSITTKMV